MKKLFVCFWWRLNAILGYIAISIIDIIVLYANRAEDDKYDNYKIYSKESKEAFWNSWNHHLKDGACIGCDAKKIN